MAFEQVGAIIRQCKDLNMVSFSLTGGDIFDTRIGRIIDCYCGKWL